MLINEQQEHTANLLLMDVYEHTQIPMITF